MLRTLLAFEHLKKNLNTKQTSHEYRSCLKFDQKLWFHIKIEIRLSKNFLHIKLIEFHSQTTLKNIKEPKYTLKTGLADFNPGSFENFDQNSWVPDPKEDYIPSMHDKEKECEEERVEAMVYQ